MVRARALELRKLRWSRKDRGGARTKKTKAAIEFDFIDAERFFVEVRFDIASVEKPKDAPYSNN